MELGGRELKKVAQASTPAQLVHENYTKITRVLDDTSEKDREQSDSHFSMQ